MNNLKDVAEQLLVHLDYKLTNGFPDEPSWGYAFTLLAALEQNQSLEENNLARKSLHYLLKQNKSTRNYSWEFVVYAWQRSVNLASALDKQALPYEEKGTRMVNWTLLRQLNRFICGRKTIRAKLIVRGIKKMYTLKDGQILDEFKTRSLQYHAFCLFVIAELLEDAQQKYLCDWLVRGVKFSLENALSDGVALYIGRGQEQIFGYGALVFAVEYVFARYPERFERKHLEAYDNIKKHLFSFQRADGSFPLVLNSDRPESPEVNFFEHKPHGWYGYNCLYDYQPFLAYCLLRADKFNLGFFK